MTLEIIRKDSDHHDERANGAQPKFLIMHYTETPDGGDADGYFTGAIPHPTGGRVSPHYMIDIDGTITQYVDENRRAWHAGVSEWEGVSDINSHSIGIELVNPGPKYGYKSFPKPQIDVLAKLSKQIMVRHNISPYNVLGHSDIAPGRKIDPGEEFPWKILAFDRVGIWPRMTFYDHEKAQLLLNDDELMKDALGAYGYNMTVELKTLITEFQRHFQPEAFFSPVPFAGTANEETALRLYALIEAKATSPSPSGRGQG